jgi:hypothetical protein
MPARQAAPPLSCLRCNRTVIDKSIYCGFCGGNRLRSAAQPQRGVMTGAPSAPDSKATVVAGRVLGELSRNNEITNKNSAKSNSKSVFVLVILIVVVLGVSSWKWLISSREFHKTDLTSSIKPSDTHNIATTLDERGALELLYGNYDVTLGGARWKRQSQTPNNVIAPEWPSSFSSFSPDSAVVRVGFQAEYEENGQPKYIVLTYAIPDSPDEFDCHACVPLIGAAVFDRHGSNWEVATQETNLMMAGAWGKPPVAQLLIIGPKKYGIRLVNSELHQGYASDTETIVTEMDARLRIIFRQDTLADSCGAKPDCESIASTIDFVPGGNSEYYDIRVISKASETTGGSTKTSETTRKYAISDGSYRPTDVSVPSDTSVPEATALISQQTHVPTEFTSPDQPAYVAALDEVIAKRGYAAIGDALFVDADGNKNKLIVQRAECKNAAGAHCQKLFISVNGHYLGTDTYKPSWAVHDMRPEGIGQFSAMYDDLSVPGKNLPPVRVIYSWDGKRLIASGTPPTRPPPSR